MSPKSPPPPPPPASTSADDHDPKEDTDSGFTLMHPAFQRHATKRNNDATNQTIYSQPNSSGDHHHQTLHAAQDLTTAVNYSGTLVGHQMTGLSHGGRSTPTTPDDGQSRELDLTSHRAKENIEKITNNNTCAKT